MHVRRILALVLCFTICEYSFSQTDDTLNTSSVKLDTFYSYSNIAPSITIPSHRPEKWGFIKHVPNNLLQIGKSPFQKKSIIPLAIVAGSTALLLWKDQQIINSVSDLSQKIHLSNETNYSALKIGDIKILKAPRNINTALYQLGDGGTSLLLAGGFYVYGKIKHDNRALQTASDITETIITMGIATQTIKRFFGRQEPYLADKPGGKWRPFPSFKEYAQHKSEYDAFCSGHVATLTATVTVLSENYPDKKWIKPVGYTLISMMSFALMNTQVHWAGDYPLAFALGYLSGKITTSRHKAKNQRKFLLN